MQPTSPHKESVNLQVRLPEPLRKRLAEEATAGGRSLNAEVVWRLMRSFEPAPAEAGLAKRVAQLEGEQKQVIAALNQMSDFFAKATAGADVSDHPVHRWRPKAE